MELLFSPLFSGSSGNAIYVGDGESGILVDAGVSCARIIKELENIGVKPESLNAILITHEHTDHTSGAGILSRKFDLPIYATEGTWNGMQDKVGAVQSKNIRLIDARQDFYIGKIGVCPFSIPHDANDPTGYRIYTPKASVAIATDLGYFADSVRDAVTGADVALLESNHDPDMLKQNAFYP
ncbi:MAG: MBL fold metallo-hydrolase, partial [Clostridia bacterium]|nr:MBL fold metallo-hydrolase [Clostridia bacterium]